MEAKLSDVKDSKAAALYCGSRSPGENSPMINTREPIKKQTLAANCITPTLMWRWKHIRIHGEGSLFYFYFLQNPIRHFHSSHYRRASIRGLLLNRWASARIIFNWVQFRKGWLVTSFSSLISWITKWQGHWGEGGEAAIYSEDKVFQPRFLYTPACRDQTLRLLCFTLRLNLSQFSVLACFSLTNWREDTQADAGDSWNWGRSLIKSSSSSFKCFETVSKALCFV